MRRVFLIIIILFIGAFVSAQDTGSGGEGDANLFSFPVSPEAGRLGTYGEVPINLSTGQIGFQVPFYTIEERGYSWPISLSYNFKGLVYEDKPSVTGLGWNLQAGGVITREVRGIPDEHPNGYYGSNDVLGRYLEPYFQTNTITRATANQLTIGDIDGEADKYHVSVNGISFSFKIGLDKTPVFISEHNYKVIFDWKNQYEIDSFKVIDDNGIQYIFEDKEYNSPVGGNFNVFNDSFTEYTSSWNISEVIFPNGEALDFTYTTREYYSYDFYASGHTNSLVINCGLSQTDLYNYNQGFSKTLIKQRILRQIESSSAKVFFEHPPIPVNTNNHRVTYNNIVVQNKYNDTTLWDYDLEYEGARDMLMTINRNNETYYSFDYYNKTLVPGFINKETDNAFKQDLWGFYNGVNNQYGVTMAGTPYEADKRPSFSHTRAGALKHIQYPTGGYTAIDYEQNTKKELYETVVNSNQNFAPNWQILLKQTTGENNLSGYKQKVYRYTFDQTVVGSIKYNLTALPGARAGVSMQKVNACEGSTNSSVSIGDYANQLRAISGEPIPEFCPRIYEQIDDGDTGGGYNNPVTKRGSTGGSIRIEAGTYEFKVWTHSSHEVSDIELLLKFYKPPSVDGDQPQYINALIGGIRTAKLTNYTREGVVANTKIYEYIDDSGYSSGKELQRAITVHNHLVEHCCNVGINQSIADQFFRANYTLKTHNPVNLNQGIPVIYTKVRESQKKSIRTVYTGLSECNTSDCLRPVGDNDTSVLTYIGNETTDTFSARGSYYYPFGYTETIFDYDPIAIPTEYPFIPRGADMDIGRTIAQKAMRYEEKNGTYSTVSSQEMEYTAVKGLVNPQGFDYNTNHPRSVKAAYNIKKEGGCTLYLDNENVFDYFSLIKYEELDKRYLQSEVVSRQHFPEEVTSTQNFNYDSKYQLKTTTVRDSEQHLMETENFYSYNPETNDAGMTDQNILTPVLGSITKNQGNVITHSKVDYHKVNERTSSGSSIFKPLKSWISSGSEPLRGNIKYDQYDDYGNLLQYFKITEDGISDLNQQTPDKGGAIMAAIWGYDYKYPIVQIVNGSYDEAISHLDVTVAQLQQLDGVQLQNELNKIRIAMPNAQITTYTYTPLVGVTSVTDPRGYSMYYEYDHLYRLAKVKDSDGNILSENEYYYKNN